jgi:hypothetical protein
MEAFSKRAALAALLCLMAGAEAAGAEAPSAAPETRFEIGREQSKPAVAPATEPAARSSLYRDNKTAFLALLGCLALGIAVTRRFSA